MRTLQTDVVIDASPAEVWAVLVDLERYGQWNPFIVELRGEAVVGARLRARMAPPGGRKMALRPRVTEVRPGEALEWLGHVGVPGLFDGRHRFELRPAGAGTLFRQREVFTGVLVPALARNIDGPTRRGLEAMNEALKGRVEALAVTG